MREFAESFYKSRTWQDCRNAYVKSKQGLCEVCLEDGIYNAGAIVHHKIHLTPQNINDPNITLNFDNLQLVCRDCHARIHGREKRYRIDAEGRVITAPLVLDSW